MANAYCLFLCGQKDFFQHGGRTKDFAGCVKGRKAKTHRSLFKRACGFVRRWRTVQTRADAYAGAAELFGDAVCAHVPAADREHTALRTSAAVIKQRQAGNSSASLRKEREKLLLVCKNPPLRLCREKFYPLVQAGDAGDIVCTGLQPIRKKVRHDGKRAVAAGSAAEQRASRHA